MKSPVSRKLSPMSKHMSGKATLRGSPMRHRPSNWESWATGKTNPIIATEPKPAQMMNIPEIHSQSICRRMKGARTIRARSRRNTYLYDSSAQLGEEGGVHRHGQLVRGVENQADDDSRVA